MDHRPQPADQREGELEQAGSPGRQAEQFLTDEVPLVFSIYLIALNIKFENYSLSGYSLNTIQYKN